MLGPTTLETALKILQRPWTSGTPTSPFQVVGAANNGITAAEAVDVDISLNRTVTFASGSFATQRAISIKAPTYASAAASVITKAATISIDSAPIGGANMTLTDSIALEINGGTLSGVTTGTSLTVNAPTGATNNFATQINGGISKFNYTIDTGTPLNAAIQIAGGINFTKATGRVGYVQSTDDATSSGVASWSFLGGVYYDKSILLNPYAGPGSNANGQLWSDSAQKCLATFQSGIKQFSTNTLFTQTATVTVGATTTETTIFGTGVGSRALPANFFAVGKTIRTICYGYISRANGTFRIRTYLGATIICDSGANTIGSPTNGFWRYESIITCRTVGVTGTVFGQAFFNYFTSATAMSSNSGYPAKTTTNTIDTTAVQTLDVRTTWSTNAAGNTISCSNATVEVLA